VPYANPPNLLTLLHKCFIYQYFLSARFHCKMILIFGLRTPQKYGKYGPTAYSGPFRHPRGGLQRSWINFPNAVRADMPQGFGRSFWQETRCRLLLWKGTTRIMSEEILTGRISFSFIPGRLYPSIPAGHLSAIYLSAPHRRLPVVVFTVFTAIMQQEI